jgi:hypothetical protein
MPGRPRKLTLEANVSCEDEMANDNMVAGLPKSDEGDILVFIGFFFKPNEAVNYP